MKRGPLAELSMSFAISISRLSDQLKETRDYNLADQVEKSGTSIGANIRESEYAQSRADFVSKLQIALKEAAETDFWLELLYRIGRLSEKDYKSLEKSCGQLIAMLTASINTASAKKTNQ